MSQDKNKKKRAKRKIVYGSFSYIFRFSGRPDEKPYAEQMESWIKSELEVHPGMGRSQVIANIVRGLIDKFVGRELIAPESHDAIELQTFRESLLAEVRNMVTGLLANPESAARMSEAATAAAKGEKVDEQIINNIMADFVGRR